MDRRSRSTAVEADAQDQAGASSERRRSPGRRSDDTRLTHAAPSAWTLRELYRALFQYWKRSLAFFVIVMALAVTTVFFSQIHIGRSTLCAIGSRECGP